jgi:xylulokinase
LLFLAFDLGTSALRGALVTGNGTTMLQTSIPFPYHEPSPGWHETAPQTWWRALRRTTAQLLDRKPPGESIAAICIGGATRAQVFLDAKGKSLGPAFLFRDRRAIDEAREIAACFPNRDPADAITAFHPLARIAWFHRHAPNAARMRIVCEPKDYLNFRLTGRVAADSVTYSRYDGLVTPNAVPDWLAACVDRLQVERIDPWSVLGPCVSRESPFDRLKNVPVLAGAMDAWMAATGAGAATPGQGYDIAGTSEVVGQITATRAHAPGLVSLRWTERASQLGGPTQAGADSAAWAYQNLRVRGRLTEAVERAASIAPRLDLPMFLPYLAGERTPVWRADLRAVFHSVGRDHGGDDLLWAVLEGVALAGHDILQYAVRRSGEPVIEVRIAGGGARSDAWCQLKADVLGVPVVRTLEHETGLTGAVVAAAVGVGHHPDIASAVTAMSKVERVFTPRADLAALFAERSVRYANAKSAALGA